MIGENIPAFREVNSHIHTPYSFSAFDRLETAFEMAKNENVAVLGINDFFVTDGYQEFYDGCLRNNIFPLFNIEFIGLLRKEQKNNIRINDPNNPGRIYLSGKGLDYPFSLTGRRMRKLKKVIAHNQNHAREIISRVDGLIKDVNPALSLSFAWVKYGFARELVRERHIARAVRVLAQENYKTEEEQLAFIEALYEGKKSKFTIGDTSALENEIRSNLLKAGGPAYIEEYAASFLELRKLIKIIHGAGGIPCYPVLLDDASGNYTEFEADPETLHRALSSLGIGCIELIPRRNDLTKLKSFTEFFEKKGYVITFGTEHNTPELIPITVTARGSVPLDESLKRIAWEGVCIIAAHQYLRAHDRQGFVLADGTLSHDQKNDLKALGNLVIEYFLKMNNDGSGNQRID